MWTILLYILRLATLDVREANAYVARMAGIPTAAYHLDAISRRESRDRRIGVHAWDAKWSERVQARAMARGLLSPLCPWHYSTSGMSTNGSHGLMYAYNVHRLPMSCLPTHSFALPVVSAWSAFVRWKERCWIRSKEYRPDGWCPQKFPKNTRRRYTVDVDRNVLEKLLIVGGTLYVRHRKTRNVFLITTNNTAVFVCKGDEWAKYKEKFNEHTIEEPTQGTKGGEPPVTGRSGEAPGRKRGDSESP